MLPARVTLSAWGVSAVLLALPAAQAQEPTATAASPTVEAEPTAADATGRPTGFATGARSPAQVGSLHRVAATLESVLDIYRLSLLELEPATRLVRQAGRQEGALPSTPIPAPAREVYQRLANTVRNRVPEAAMPPLARGYHAEVMDALVALGTAESIGEVRKPTRLLVFAMRKVAESAHAVVDLFSRERPVQARVIDNAAIFEELADALDEFAAAENEIRRRRRQGGSQDEIAGAFRRTEIALGHLLDLWAAARQLGIDLTDRTDMALLDLKVSPQISTESLQLITARVEERATGLEEVVASLDVRPPPLQGALRVFLEEAEDHKATAHLSWSPYPTEGRPAALLRVERIDDKEATLQRLVTLFLCQGQAEDAAAASAAEAMAEFDDSPLVVKELPPGHVTTSDILSTAPVAPPRYRVIPVSPFGVEGGAAEATAQYVPRKMEGARRVMAKLEEVGVEHPRFYRWVDRVTVTWELPASDVAGRPGAAAFAAHKQLPVVERYEVERIIGNTAQRLVSLKPGTREFVDHPPLDGLERGVRYRVFAVSANGDLGRVTSNCDISNGVKGPVAQRLQLAAAGATRLKRPSHLEREVELQLRDDALLRQRRKAFDALPYQEQRAWLERWWASRSAEQRRQWLRGFPKLWEKGREAWLNRWSGELFSRDADWGQAAVFMRMEGDELESEVERWWALLDEDTQAELRQEWLSSLNRDYLLWVKAEREVNDEARKKAEAPLRLLTWWRSRGELERSRLHTWWTQLDETERREALVAWYRKLPPAARDSVRWPDWEQLTKEERQGLLSAPPSELPPPLWRSFLAWHQWETLSFADRMQALEAEVGVVSRTWSSIQYGLRPLDKRIGFRALLLLLLSVLGTATIWFGLRGVSTYLRNRASG